jgi:hypothetical protein
LFSLFLLSLFKMTSSGFNVAYLFMCRKYINQSGAGGSCLYS